MFAVLLWLLPRSSKLCSTPREPKSLNWRNMYKVDVRVDGKEAAAIDRRRIQEYQRQSRIFNAKQRLIGVRVSNNFIASCLLFIYN